MKIDKAMRIRWTQYCVKYCADYGKTPDEVTDAITAWTIAHKVDLPREAYHIGANDTHIRTALKQIFANAVFG